MMKNMTLEQIADACHGSYHGPEEKKRNSIDGVVIDSRLIKKDYLFVAVKGEKTDGHKYAEAVLEQGAAAVLAERPLPEGAEPYILVDSTTQALKSLAKYYRAQLSVKVVGITGSVGKTSTKETIASVLAQKYHVLKTEGNFNNEIGLPLTVFKIREEHEVAVLEMGISEFGEMERLSEIACPDIGVITNIGICHLENLKTRDGILKAKTEMFHHLKPEGTVILNGDDDKLSLIGEVNGKQPVFFGIDSRKENYADQIENLGLEGMKAVLHLTGYPQEVPVHLGTPGRHNVYNALAAACVGQSLGLTAAEIRAGLEQAETIAGRTNLIHGNGITIIDDCYNANPVSMKEALDILDTASGRKVAVLGDMGELGAEEKTLHYEVGTHLAATGIDQLFCAGKLSQETALAARKNDRLEVHAYDSREELEQELFPAIKKGDTVLVKASHFMDFPKIVERLKEMDYR